MKQKVDEYTVPANHDPATIADVFSIVVSTTDKETGRVHNEIVHLDGTVKEKLQQYQEATGKAWNGHEEQVFGVYKEVADVSLDLNAKLERILSDTDKEIQTTIDNLTKKAERLIQENETVKARQKLVTTLSTKTQ